MIECAEEKGEIVIKCKSSNGSKIANDGYIWVSTEVMLMVVGGTRKKGGDIACFRKPEYLLSEFFSVDVLSPDAKPKESSSRRKKKNKFRVDYGKNGSRSGMSVRKRAKILESEGERQAHINIADGKKSCSILESEAARMEQVNQETDAACSTQLIDGDGTLSVSGVDNFTKEVKVEECGLFICDWKSTILNHLFGANFREMEASRGRSQTTKGDWIARCTVVMDFLEGTERGEDDTAFEKQSALLALAVSDKVLINMLCQDIGREQAANKPLLKTAFQVMMRLFSPTLMFVMRDKTQTALENLEPEDIKKIWQVIRDNKDLDLGAHKVMVETVRCEEIANEKFPGFIADEVVNRIQKWRELEEVWS